MKLTRLFKTGFTALVCGAFGAPMAHAAYTTGDLLMAFRSTTSTANTFVVDIGQASLYRDATSSIDVTGSLGASLNAGLTAAFGAGWAIDAGLYMGILGGSQTALTGDGTGNVSYVGKLGTGSSLDAGYSTLAGGARNALAGRVLDFSNNASGSGSFNPFVSNGANAANVSLGGKAAVIATSNSNDYTDYIGTAYFDSLPLGGELKVTDAFGGSKLDLFRILGNVTGATDAPTAAGVSQFQGSFSISNTGTVSFDPGVVAAPEPSRVILLGLGLSGLFLRRRRASK
ncbi:MAG: hypothetical protein JWR15_537 [Prosthecobacter sp.]|nr:hypothetical protein [Prosthecobacter sp.]